MKKIWIWFFAFAFTIPSMIIASGYKSFSTEVSASGASLGNMGFLLVGDGSTLHWNPAMMAFVQYSKVNLSVSSYLVDTHSYYLDYMKKKGKMGIGVSLFLNNISNIELRDVPSPDPDGITSSQDAYLGFSLAKQVRDNFSLGANLKYIFTSLYSYQASGFAADFSAVRKVKEKYFIMAGVRNVGFSSKLGGVKVDLPLEFLFGTWVEKIITQKNNAISLGIQTHIVQVEPKSIIRISIGTRYEYKEKVNVNLGYQSGNDIYSFYTGIGYTYQRLVIQYAFALGRHNINNAQYVTIQFAL